MAKLICFLVLLTLSISSQATSEKLTVTLGIIEIPTLSEANGDGDFLILLERIEKIANLSFQLKFGPGQRVRDWFQKREVEGYFPALENSITGDYRTTLSFFDKRILSFSLTPTLLTTPAQMANKSIAYTRGYTYPPALMNQTDVSYIDVSTQEQGLYMLLKQRVDVFIGDYETTFRQISELKQQQPSHYKPIYFDPNQPLSIEPTFIALQKTQRGAEITRRINQAITQLRAQNNMPERTH